MYKTHSNLFAPTTQIMVNKEEKRSAIIDQATFDGQKTAQAFGRDISYELTLPRSKLGKIAPAKASQGNNWKLPKNDLPGPCSYENAKAFDTMVSPRTLGSSKSTLNRVSYTESYAKLKKFVPAPSKYKEIDRGFVVSKKHGWTFGAEKLFQEEKGKKV